MTLRLAFMGSPDFAVPALSALADAGHEIACVYSQPPRPAGRGQRDRPCPVHAFAQKRGWTVRTPASFREPPAVEAFRELGLDVAVVAAYGLLLPKPVLDAPRHGCLNIHASLLPRWRGAAPIQRAILAGDEVTGISIMQMDEGLDTGAILLSRETAIDRETTAETLHDRLAASGAEAVVAALDGLEKGILMPTPQPEDGAVYAPKLARQEGRIDWTRPACDLERLVRAFTPWPGAWFDYDGERVKVLAAEVVNGAGDGAAPGTVLDDCLTVATSAGGFRPKRVQRPGKAAMATSEMLRGHPLPAGTMLH